ncbi:hypothetical protein [Microbacterium excoecariae]|uniref:hypothetical protein n=1 Tax=Microbacterium excoecariae TaxID=2715210 RepID=UPI00140A5C35|nr:hypothetical protein [Microbacterium excoecariae]NHI16852.1 hypothetical protein [Microbacterium excoecariae]
MDRMIGRALDLAPDNPHRERIASNEESRAGLEPTGYRDGAVHVITGNRQHGKTTLALTWLLEPDAPPRVLITRTREQARLLKHAAGLALSDPRILSYREVQNARHDRRAPVQYGIDESLDILTGLLGLPEPPHLITVTTATDQQAG